MQCLVVALCLEQDAMLGRGSLFGARSNARLLLLARIKMQCLVVAVPFTAMSKRKLKCKTRFRFVLCSD